MADDNNNKKKILDNAGERTKGAFTGEDGSVFWACKEIYNALKVGVQALNVQLGKMGRFADESKQKASGNDAESADNRPDGVDLADEFVDGAYYGAEDARDYRQRTQRQDGEIDSFARRDRFDDGLSDLQ